jgi:uncharacterized membrane protein YhaH (DUF805 family)
MFRFDDREAGQMMDLVYLLFSPKGRINRAKYLLAAWLFVLIGVGGVILVTVLTDSTAAAWTYAIVVCTPIGWSSIVLGIKRLHDRNKSGWWVLLFYLAPNVLDNLASSAERYGNSTVQIVAVVIGLVIGIWGFVELVCLRGTTGPNQYGPDPLTKDISNGGVTGRP